MRRYIVTVIPVALCIVICLSPGAFGDVIKMKNGRTYEGKIISKDSETVVLKMQYGEIKLKVAEIESISKGETKEDEYKKKAAELTDDDADGHFALALWCKKNKLPKQYKDELARVVGINPDYGRARNELGQVKYNGKWVDKKIVEDEIANPWKKEVRKKLKRKVTGMDNLVFAMDPIDVVAEKFEKAIGVSVIVDAKVLKKCRRKKLKITAQGFRGRSLEYALFRILSSNALDYTLKDGGLLIHKRKRQFSREEMIMQLDERYLNMKVRKKSSLETVAVHIKAHLKINIAIDGRIYDKFPKEKMQVEYVSKNESLRMILTNICAILDLDFIVKKNVIMITTKKLAKEYRIMIGEESE